MCQHERRGESILSQVLLPKIASYCNHTRLAVATNSRILSFPCRLATFQQILLVIIFCNVKPCSLKSLSYTVVPIRANDLFCSFLLFIIVVVNTMAILSSPANERKAM
jgi:hypothetical protein